MRVFAPGKIVLTGAYAVLEGAPAIVLATTRGAYADASRVALSPSAEVRAAIGDAAAPHVDASQLFVGARKLGLGSSAAVLVASLAAREAQRGADLSDPKKRDALFHTARAAHAEAQGGGSGIDVAASVYGGVLRYSLGSHERIALPAGTRITVLACATSARTSDLRAQVDRLARANPIAYRACMDDLASIARDAASAAANGNRGALVDAIQRTSRSLIALGAAAGAPIVPAGFDALADAAIAEGSGFCVSGAGGGDVAIFVGSSAPSSAFLERAHALGLFTLDCNLDEKGVRLAPPQQSFFAAPVAT